MSSVIIPASLTHRRSVELRCAFTLVELLVTLGIIALLLGILVPAFASARNEARAFVCMDHVRAAVFDFRLFADPQTARFRGDSERHFHPRFDATDFLESLYETGEFWDHSDALIKSEPYRPGQKPIICPAGPRGLTRYPQLTSAEGVVAVGPKDKVSFAMNRRLLSAPVTLPGVAVRLQHSVTIGERILDHPYVPLMFDVNAAQAVEAQEEPFFSAPPGQRAIEASVYDSGRYWFPAYRHNGRMSIGFVGGHVVSTAKPLADASWDWDYHPPIGTK